MKSRFLIQLHTFALSALGLIAHAQTGTPVPKLITAGNAASPACATFYARNEGGWKLSTQGNLGDNATESVKVCFSRPENGASPNLVMIKQSMNGCSIRGKVKMSNVPPRVNQGMISYFDCQSAFAEIENGLFSDTFVGFSQDKFDKFASDPSLSSQIPTLVSEIILADKPNWAKSKASATFAVEALKPYLSAQDAKDALVQYLRFTSQDALPEPLASNLTREEVTQVESAAKALRGEDAMREAAAAQQRVDDQMGAYIRQAQEYIKANGYYNYMLPEWLKLKERIVPLLQNEENKRLRNYPALQAVVAQMVGVERTMRDSTNEQQKILDQRARDYAQGKIACKNERFESRLDQSRRSVKFSDEWMWANHCSYVK